MDTENLIIIGAGGMGCAAAYHAAKAGLKPLLLEQFALGHNLGSSHGGSRITRYANPDAEECRIIPETFRLWRTLERESGERLLDITGSLMLGPEEETFLVDTQQALEANRFDYELLSAATLQAAYPQFRLPASWIGLQQADAGKLAADRCVAAMAEQAIANGAQLRENSAVARIDPASQGATITLAGGEQLYGRRLIISAGPWAQRFLEPLLGRSLDMRVTRQQVAYFPVTKPALYDPETCPVYIFAAEPNLYGFPILEYPGHIKIALENETETTDPDRPREVMAANVEALSAAVARHFNGVTPQPESIQTCLYTETPQRQFIVDRHQDFPHIAFAAGFSGRGFKFTIAIGKQLLDLLSD